MDNKNKIKEKLKEIESQIEFNKEWLKSNGCNLKPSEYSNEENDILNLITKKNLLKWVLSSINSIS